MYLTRLVFAQVILVSDDPETQTLGSGFFTQLSVLMLFVCIIISF